MKIRLFPKQFLEKDSCFGLYRSGPESLQRELPLTIEAESHAPIHIVHSDPRYIAYFAGLIVLQAWTRGIAELGAPSVERNPLLIITDEPGRFGEAYLSLHMPSDEIRKLSSRRRVTLYEKTGRPPKMESDKSGYWEEYLDQGDTRTRLHNFFPAFQLLRAGSQPKIIASREHLGRGDGLGPAVLIVRRSDRENLRELQERYTPLLAIVDSQNGAIRPGGLEFPFLVFHRSIFAPEMTTEHQESCPPLCLPDAKFDHFCNQSNLDIIQPEEVGIATKTWNDIDGALQALMERVNERRHPVLLEIRRSTLRLRNLLLSLPSGIQQYEQSLILSGQPESLWYNWSITQPLQALENRMPEVAAIGEWEEFIVQEFLSGFQEIQSQSLKDSPKLAPLISLIRGKLNESRRCVLVVSGQAYATALRCLISLPSPLGFGFPADKVTATTIHDLGSLEPDQDCVLTQAIDPHEIFTNLVPVGPRNITFILLRNELRFVAERLLRTKLLFPAHSANRLLQPIHQLAERLEPVAAIPNKSRTSTLFSDGDFELALRMFNYEGKAIEHGTVLIEDSDALPRTLQAETEAHLIRLENDKAVFIDASSHLTYVEGDDSIASGPPSILQPGHRLIIVNPAARESIAHRIIAARQGEEMEDTEGQVILRWQRELAEGIRRSSFTQSEVLEKIRALGSERISPLIIGQWLRGEVLGPLDAQDIRRTGMAIGSEWLLQNWQRVSASLLIMRSGHRLLGRRITRLIKRAAVGDCELSARDEDFLKQLGISMGELQDAVTLLEIEAVSGETKMVPIEQVGKLILI